MSVAFVLPEGFQYIGPAVFSTVLVLIGQSVVVGKYRKRAKIDYPQVYAEKKEMETSRDALVFNCAQRAHQNTLESIPIVYAVTILSGLSFPIFSAFACTLWSIERVSYTRGYLTGDPEKRLTLLHRVATFPIMGLFFGAMYTSGVALQIPRGLGFAYEILKNTFQLGL